MAGQGEREEWEMPTLEIKQQDQDREQQVRALQEQPCPDAGVCILRIIYPFLAAQLLLASPPEPQDVRPAALPHLLRLIRHM